MMKNKKTSSTWKCITYYALSGAKVSDLKFLKPIPNCRFDTATVFRCLLSIQTECPQDGMLAFHPSPTLCSRSVVLTAANGPEGDPVAGGVLSSLSLSHCSQPCAQSDLWTNVTGSPFGGSPVQRSSHSHLHHPGAHNWFHLVTLLPFTLSLEFLFHVPPKGSLNMWVNAWLISLSMILSRSIGIVSNGRISALLMAE